MANVYRAPIQQEFFTMEDKEEDKIPKKTKSNPLCKYRPFVLEPT
jgi:hypothetical protein